MNNPVVSVWENPSEYKGVSIHLSPVPLGYVPTSHEMSQVDKNPNKQILSQFSVYVPWWNKMH